MSLSRCGKLRYGFDRDEALCEVHLNSFRMHAGVGLPRAFVDVRKQPTQRISL